MEKSAFAFAFTNCMRDSLRGNTWMISSEFFIVLNNVSKNVCAVSHGPWHSCAARLFQTDKRYYKIYVNLSIWELFFYKTSRNLSKAYAKWRMLSKNLERSNILSTRSQSLKRSIDLRDLLEDRSEFGTIIKKGKHVSKLQLKCRF